MMMSGGNNNAIFSSFSSLWHLSGGGLGLGLDWAMITLLLWLLLLLSSGSITIMLIVEYYWRSTTIRIPRSIAWVGVRHDELFSRPRAWIRELTAGLSTVHEGYATHNQKGKPFALLDTAGRPNIILPKELSRWLVAQPDDVLNSRKVIDTKFAIDYLIPHIRPELGVGMTLAIRRDLTRNLGRTQKASFNAIRARADEVLLLGSTGRTTTTTTYDDDDDDDHHHHHHIDAQSYSWHEVNLATAIRAVISAVSNRMLVGDQLYHNKAFMRSLDRFGNMLGLASLLIGQYAPFFIRPLVGYLASVVVRAYRRRALKYMVPAARERIEAIRKQKKNLELEYEAPMDIMQWIISACPDASADEIAALILSLALGATHTSVIISIGTFLDLLSSPPELGYYEAIRQEAASVFRTEEDFGNLASLHKLSRVDSAIKESMRLNPLSGRGNMQEVVQPNGVVLPDGQKIPRGAWLGVSLTGISHDGRYYDNPDTYDPFRFSRARTEIAHLMEEDLKNESAASSIDNNSASTTISTNSAVSEVNGVDVDYSTEPAIGKKIIDNSNGITTTDRNKLNGSWLSTTAEDFGTFGFGRHSCPGRWFASHVMKMTVAYIALSYEIQPLNNGRPSNIIIGDVIVPPQNVMIKVRRRR